MGLLPADDHPRLFHIDCMVTPNLEGLDLGLRNRVWFDSVARRFSVEGQLDERDVRQLRECEGSAEWQVVIDQIAAKTLIDYDVSSSAYPLTKWGLLKKGLSANSAEAWQSFMDDYRKPIAKSIRKILHRRGRTVPADVDLADGFFSWFYGEQVFTRLSIFNDDGKLNRFRGYLRLCIRTYINQEYFHRQAAELADDLADDSADADATIIDTEYCRAMVEEELFALKIDDYSLWFAMMCDVQNLTLKEVAEQLDGSISSAHRDRQRAREKFRSRLVERRLSRGTITSDEALAEYQALVPLIAAALKRYVDENPVDTGGATFRRGRRSMPSISLGETDAAGD